jgi:sarcosine oxidase gamma subunit
VSLAFRNAAAIVKKPAASTSPTLPSQTVIRNILFLSEAVGRKSQAASLLDISGRNVMELKSGANDVRALAPGVYFVLGPKTEDGGPGAAGRKVVLTE